MWLSMKTMFQTTNLLIPRPPSFLGTQIFSQATLTRAFSSFSFYKNVLNFCSNSRIILLGRIKIIVQQFGTVYIKCSTLQPLKKKHEANCVSYKAGQNFIIVRGFSKISRTNFMKFE
jgi:hypothetical protein